MRRLAGLLLLVALAGCTSVREDLDRDAERVAAHARERLAIDARIAAPQDDAAAIETEIRGWLARDLDEDVAVRIALLNSPALRLALDDLGLGRIEVVQAGLLSNPLISANAKFFSDGTEVELGISQSLLDVFLLPLRQRIAASKFRATEAAVTREIVHTAHEARRAFRRAQAQQQLEAIAIAKVAAAESSLELMTRLHAAGNVTDPMLTQQSIDLGNARLERDAAHLETLDLRADLDLALGLRGDDTHWTLRATLALDPLAGLVLDDIESRAVEASFDLARVNAEIESAGGNVTLASRQALIPDLTGGVVGKQESAGGFGVGPSVGLGIPVFDTGAARIAAAELRRSQHLREQLAIATKIEIQARRLRDRLLALSARAMLFEESVLPTHERLVHETLQQYNAMQIGAFDVLEARHHQLDAQRGHLEALRDAWLARGDLEELLQGALVL